MLISWKAFLKLSHDFHFGYLGELEGSIDRLNLGFFFFFKAFLLIGLLEMPHLACEYILYPAPYCISLPRWLIH